MHHAFIQAHNDARLVIHSTVYSFTRAIILNLLFTTIHTLLYSTREDTTYFPRGHPTSRRRNRPTEPQTTTAQTRLRGMRRVLPSSTFPISTSYWAILTQNPFTTVLDRPLSTHRPHQPLVCPRSVACFQGEATNKLATEHMVRPWRLMELRSTTNDYHRLPSSYRPTTTGMDHLYFPFLRHLSVHACTSHLTRVYQLVWSQVGG